MARLLFFAVFVLGTALHCTVGQEAGFLSIDCGLESKYSGYTDTDDGIFYVSDDNYVDGGENHRVSAADEGSVSRPQATLRSFPSGLRNCYALPTKSGSKYLARVHSVYGNYDGKNNSATLQFDVYLGVNYWDTVRPNVVSEVLFVARASWTPVCFVNTDHGTPFVSTLELRLLGSDLYPLVTANKSLSMFQRRSMGSKIRLKRYDRDRYDRFWWQMPSNSAWNNISTESSVKENANYAEPLSVMQTAVESVSTNTTLEVPVWEDQTPAREFILILHFADFQNSQLRQFNITFNNNGRDNYSPPHLATDAFVDRWKAPDGKYTVRCRATAASKLPPMLNAYEFYAIISHDNPMTSPTDFDIIMSIKLEYGIKKNWTGDPCFPAFWEGVKCSNPSDSISRIISLDLSNSNLHGAISNNFTLFTALQYLNLAGNQLSGPIPGGLCNKRSFTLSLDSNGDPCIPAPPPEKNGNRTLIIAISVVVPVIAIVALVLAYLIWRHKRKPNVSSADLPRELEVNIAPASRKDNGDPLTKVENRRFTYKELEKITNNFVQFIGQGGFGLVYYGRLENGMEVAVKVRSESSSHGLDEFFAEVQSLTKVHHRNLVSLVGYCREKDHLALVYEYMARGSLYDHMRGNNGVRETLNWRTRLRVVIEAAQGLDYLHKGCNLPIIHRDVKTQNILLGQNLQAKIADFGLCKTYLSDTQTHISVNPAGSAGYMDPECYQTGRLTESSDVYSFGVVLLQIVTGESPILPGQGHIIQLVRKKISAGNISLVADARLGDAYDVSSMWKVVDIALSCTADIGVERPTMAAVVIQLKESLVLEEARLDSGFRGSISTMSDTSVPTTTTLSPLAR
ncbi:probable LRR receptor-like serine/threonine-protein kinase At1g51810 [Oryza brachyantha]|uniref:probable LRR receptor-like serine/threonine-protein kinase At1g51810 n=1 Tax=Oryza brachyantha TaxID=4533 RepID=UPI000776AAA2|nr:probable LRR receptor-like serine/threonine-protein kinase At1g51810 [Oryza brachyantha]